jgi:hypothetical protein
MKLWHLVVFAALVAALVVGGKLVHHRGNRTGTAVASLVQGVPARAAGLAAQANVEAAFSPLQQYYAEHGSYVGVSTTALRQYDASLSGTLVVRATATGVCVQDTVRGVTASATRPGSVAATPCP